MKNLVLLLLCSLATACGTSDSQNQTRVDNSQFNDSSIAREQNPVNADSSTALPQNYLRFETLTPLPAEAKKCGDLYYLANKEAGEQQYIFVTAMSHYALIKINGQIIKLEKDPNNLPVSSKKDFIHIYQNDSLKVIQDVIETGMYEDGAYYEGTLELQKNGQSVKVPIQGRTGC